MRAIVFSCAVVAVIGASECRAMDWEVNLESNLNSSPPLFKLEQAGYRWDVYGDMSPRFFGSSPDLLKAEARFRPSSVGPLDWEIGIGATLKPSARLDGYDPRGGRALGDFDGGVMVRATIRSRPARSGR